MVPLSWVFFLSFSVASRGIYQKEEESPIQTTHSKVSPMDYNLYSIDPESLGHDT